MKKKKIITLLLIISLLLAGLYNPKSYAEDVMSEEDFFAYLHAKYENITGGNTGATGAMQEGIVDYSQGWIIYGVDKYGSVVANPYIVGSGYESKCDIIQLSTRLGGVEPQGHTSISIPKSFYFSGSAGISNWEAVRDYIWNGIYDGMLYDMWPGSEFAASFEEENRADYDYYLILEPFYWHGLHKLASGSSTTITMSDAEMQNRIEQYKEELEIYYYDKCHGIVNGKKLTTKMLNMKINMALSSYKDYLISISTVTSSGSGYQYTGTYYCGTVYNGSRYEDSAGFRCFDGVYSFRHGGFCTFCKFDKELFGIGAGTKSANISNADIQSAGYGIAA